ncbi:transcriptional regulator, HxlR family [Streptomyces sp. di188]|nr:transcriptional regulator, HxlR family [Streptomyces sp. di50b]SCE09546.1 transcriptional regulator, HxlR family [Streptomyces sp. di188]
MVGASRLTDMERDGLTTRRRLPPPGAAYVYELTARGRELLPVLQALGAWGRPELGDRRPTDAVRAHWFALPLLRELEGDGLVEVRLDEGCFHVHAGAAEADGPVYGDGPAPPTPTRSSPSTPRRASPSAEGTCPSRRRSGKATSESPATARSPNSSGSREGAGTRRPSSLPEHGNDQVPGAVTGFRA